MTDGSSQAPPAASLPNRPARVVAVQTLGPRLRDLTVDSPALGRTAKVRLLLPRRFEAEPDRRWPVLWLLHGCCDSYRQLLEREYHAGDRRAVAGLSMGGLGAMAYAARHPGMFRAAAAFSGILDTRYQGGPISGPTFIQNLVRAFGENPSALWGDPQRQAAVWAAHNPYDLAGRLRGVDLFVSVGNGQPGPLDPPAPTRQARQIEQALQPQTLAFVDRLHQLAIPVQVDAYGPGTHDWPYWQRELHRSLPLLLRALGSR